MTHVLLVDDQEMIRLGLRTIIDAHPDFTVVGEAADGFAALTFLNDHDVDLILMDVRMPGIDGVETTRRIRERIPSEQTRIVVLTTFEHDDTVLAALRAGANGFLGKGVGPAELIVSLQEVIAGEVPCPQQPLPRSSGTSPTARAASSTLTSPTGSSL